MINIRPVSDLRNKYAEIENLIATQNEPVYLTKNGHGALVIMSLDHYSSLTDDIEKALDAADAEAKSTTTRYTASEVFGHARKIINAS